MKASRVLDFEKEKSLKRVTLIVYVLQALAFLNGVTAIAGAVVSYIVLDDVRDTWLESHVRWQIRTFWFGLFWYVVGFLTMFVFVGVLILIGNTIWVIYRIAKGWIKLNEFLPIE